MPEQMRLILRHVDEVGYEPTLQSYLRGGGYEALRKALSQSPESIRNAVLDSGLRERGGVGCLIGLKWKDVDYTTGKPLYLIANVGEIDPGTFKDRQILSKDPHQLIEGMVIAAYALQASRAFIYIRGEMAQEAHRLECAIEEARAGHFIGENILGGDFSCDLYVHRGAGCYICGEQTALIESLEGKRPYPRIKTPYNPGSRGLYQCPTVVNNVETLCQVKHLIAMGPQAYASIGKLNNPGTRIFSVSGHVQRPGCYEFPCGMVTLGELIYDVCGGLPAGRQLKAVLPGGFSSKILRADKHFTGILNSGIAFDWTIGDIPLDFDSLLAVDSTLGAGGIIVLDDSSDMLQVLANINAFFAHESCGQCTPCREGSSWMTKITQRLLKKGGQPSDIDLMRSLADQIEGLTGCAHGEATARPVQSIIDAFKDELLYRIFHVL